jgi:hypothetical protein
VTGGSEDYDRSRRVFNAMIDRYPAVIVRYVDVTDVVHGIEFAHRHCLPCRSKAAATRSQVAPSPMPASPSTWSV